MDENCFLNAICEDPFDDAPRLVYADWLEERGESDYPEFVRLSCRLAELVGEQNLGFEPGTAWFIEDPVAMQIAVRCRDIFFASEEFQKRKQICVGDSGICQLRYVVPRLADWRRGFPRTWQGDHASFVSHDAANLFGRLPITEVKLTGKGPSRHVGDRSWYGWWSYYQNREVHEETSDDIYPPLWEFLRTTDQVLSGGRWATYYTKEAAVQSLSAACVAYGRSKAGLKPLPTNKM